MSFYVLKSRIDSRAVYGLLRGCGGLAKLVENDSQLTECLQIVKTGFLERLRGVES